ncbi:IS3 family transposase [Thermophilibacter provencensis]|uniref:IS3 family transposase n=1 Tax=Thermophilibacter provencensis TaxID=1852386 RepID=UPI0013566305|nr:IS3 family transposase [Thermophilibacter provencensis]
MKAEMLEHGDWSAATLDDLEGAIRSYIEWHNSRRRKRSLGSLSPMEYRKSMDLAA